MHSCEINLETSEKTKSEHTLFTVFWVFNGSHFRVSPRYANSKAVLYYSNSSLGISEDPNRTRFVCRDIDLGFYLWFAIFWNTSSSVSECIENLVFYPLYQKGLYIPCYPQGDK